MILSFGLCSEVKLRLFHPPPIKLINATSPWQCNSIDLVRPKGSKTGNIHMFTVIGECKSCLNSSLCDDWQLKQPYDIWLIFEISLSQISYQAYPDYCLFRSWVHESLESGVLVKKQSRTSNRNLQVLVPESQYI